MQKLYFGGPIITMENETDDPEAVLIDSDSGKILAVGTYEELSAQASEDGLEAVDLAGRCLMPAFIDAHSHASMAGQSVFYADLSDCHSHAEIIAVLRDFIEKRQITQEQAVFGTGYDHNFLLEQSHPDRQILDQASRQIPIVVTHVSGHLACANTIAMKLAGVTKDTPNPPGGLIEKDAATGEPTGYFEESGMAAVRLLVGSRIVFDEQAMLDKMHQVYLENGITTAQDGATSESGMAFLKNAADDGQLKIDIVAYPMLSAECQKLMSANTALVETYKNRLKIGGYKLILDGSPQGRSAWMSKPYLNGPKDYCGYPRMADEEMYRLAQIAVNEGRQLLVHCNGDAASEQFLNAYEAAVAASKNPARHTLRPVMIHCQTVRNDQLDRMAKLHMIASIFIGHVWYWGDIHLKNFGPERGNHISPARDALDRGIVITLHQDTPVTKPDMLHSVWCAVNRKSRDGLIIGDDQKISVYEALKAVTLDAAYQYFEEKEKGSLLAGKQADLVILDRSPLAVDADEIKDIVVLETITQGKTVFQK